MRLEFYYTVAALIGVLSAGRMVRLLVNDDFPPAVWVRMKWDAITNDGPWSKIVHCGWCASPYICAVVLAWALLSNLHWTWWVANGLAAGSYVASWIVFHDEDGSD